MVQIRGGSELGVSFDPEEPIFLIEIAIHLEFGPNLHGVVAIP